MSNWIWLTPRPEPNDRRAGKVMSWRNTEPILVNLDLVALIEPVRFRDPVNDEIIDGSYVVWHGSSPRTSWTVMEPPDQIVGRQG